MKKHSKYRLGKLFLVIFILIFNPIMPYNVEAQTVGYTYKALSAEGCNVKYSVAKQNNQYYIIVTVSSDRMKFLKESTMMVRTTDGTVLKFSGELLDNETQSAGIVSGNIVLPVSSIKSTAQFKVTPEQFESLKDGIIKVRLSTIPIEHEREFKKDKIGKKLYKFFIEAQNKENDF